MHRILIVSDEEFLRDVIRLSLADMQADVRCASDVPDMQRMVRRMLFDLVVVVGTSAFFTGCAPPVSDGRWSTSWRGSRPNRRC